MQARPITQGAGRLDVRRGPGGGPLLSEVRAGCLAKVENPDLRSLFWDGFYEYCGERQDFVSAYSDPSNRAENGRWVATFGLGLRDVHSTAYFAQRDGWVGVNLLITDVALYEGLLARAIRSRRCSAVLAVRFSGESRARRTASLWYGWTPILRRSTGTSCTRGSLQGC